MRSIIEFWSSFRLLPSAWLLLVQFILLILAMLTFDNEAYRTLTWALGVLALLIIAKVIRQTPMFTFLGLAFVSGAIIASVFILLGYSNLSIQIFAHSCEALAYFSAAYGLFRYMFADRYLTRDELFAAAAVLPCWLGDLHFYITFVSYSFLIAFKIQTTFITYKLG